MANDLIDSERLGKELTDNTVGIIVKIIKGLWNLIKMFRQKRKKNVD